MLKMFLTSLLLFNAAATMAPAALNNIINMDSIKVLGNHSNMRVAWYSMVNVKNCSTMRLYT